MENERNAQAAAQPAEEKKPVEEKKPGYPMHKRKYTPLYTIIVFLYGLLVKLLFFMKIEGRENVPKDRNCILMGNHQCLLDPVTLALCVPDREIHFMGKKELFENKALGWVFRQVHGFPVDRGNMDMGAIRTAMGVLKAGETLGIFPEGTRNKTDDLMLPFKEGSFKMAEKTGCAIVPMAITGSADILENHFPKVKATHVILEYGKPIYPNELDKETKKKIGAHCQGVIEEMLVKNEKLR